MTEETFFKTNLFPMKVVWKEPDIERTIYGLTWENKISIIKSTVWYKGPKNRKWWKINRDRVEYSNCYSSSAARPCSSICFWSRASHRYRHKEKLRWSKEHSNWTRQERGLCIERNLTSWIFRFRYRRNKAATTIQRWYRGIFPFRLFKRAKAHWISIQPE